MKTKPSRGIMVRNQASNASVIPPVPNMCISSPITGITLYTLPLKTGSFNDGLHPETLLGLEDDGPGVALSDAFPSA